MTMLDILAFIVMGLVAVALVWELSRVAWEVVTALVFGTAFAWAFIHVINFFLARGAIPK